MRDQVTGACQLDAAYSAPTLNGFWTPDGPGIWTFPALARSKLLAQVSMVLNMNPFRNASGL